MFVNSKRSITFVSVTNTTIATMTKRLTKREMFKEIFFDATEGKRSNENFVDGMTLIDCLPNYLSKEYMTHIYNEFINEEKCSRHILSNVASNMRWYGNNTQMQLGRMLDKFLMATR